jgi:hypothetical protein
MSATIHFKSGKEIIIIDEIFEAIVSRVRSNMPISEYQSYTVGSTNEHLLVIKLSEIEYIVPN